MDEFYPISPMAKRWQELSTKPLLNHSKSLKEFNRTILNIAILSTRLSLNGCCTGLTTFPIDCKRIVASILLISCQTGGKLVCK